MCYLEECKKLLIDNDEYNEFMFDNIYENKNNMVLAIMQFRKDLISKGRGDVKLIQLQNNIYDKDRFAELLQELFLEYITEENIDHVINLSRDSIENLDKIYQKQQKNKNYRLARVLALTGLA